MCVIASIPAGRTLSEDELREMWQTNPDGAGIAWISGNKVATYKSMKLKPFLRKFKQVVEHHGQSDILVHMRIATHGEVCLDNNHPFVIKQDGKEVTDVVFAHNGILPRAFIPPAKMNISDTRYFNNVFWSNFNIESLDDKRVMDMVGDVITQGAGWNKFVVLSARPTMQRESYIINESQGSWEGGVWYSNRNHDRTRFRDYGNTWNGYKGSEEDDKNLQRIIDNSDKEIVKMDFWDDSCEIPLTDEEADAVGMMSGVYDDHLIHDPTFLPKISKLLDKTGYESIEDACDALWFEFDYKGDTVCPDCGLAVDISDEKFPRMCNTACMFYGYEGPDASEYYESVGQAKADADAEASVKEMKLFDDSQLNNKKETKTER